MYGNFQGLTSPVIDLTLSDIGDVTFSQGRRKIKKEPVKKEEDEEFVIPLKSSTEVSQSDADSTVSSKKASSKKATKRKHSKLVAMRKTKKHSMKTPLSLATEQSVNDTSDDQSPLTKVNEETMSARPSRFSLKKPRAAGNGPY